MLRTVGDLEEAIWAELAWRKKELLQVNMRLKAAPAWAVGMDVRAGITPLYAHWEGFVKAASERLVEHVGSQRLSYGELSAGYLAIALSKDLDLVRESEKSRAPDLALTRILVGRENQPATLRPRAAAITGSNLSWKQFRSIAETLELRSKQFQLLENLINSSLVDERNTIAHGSPSAPISGVAYGELHAHVLGLLDGVAKEVLRVADKRLYKRRP